MDVRRSMLGVAMAGLALLASACARGTTTGASCAGDWFPVGGAELSFVGKGGRNADTYVVTDLVLRSRNGERVVVSMYDGALLSLPADAMNGYAAWNDHRVEVVDADVRVPAGSIGPCAVFSVEPLPDGWQPPTADDAH